MTRMKYSQNMRNRLSDRDIFHDLLVTEKYMSHFYDHAVLESSNDLARDTLQTMQQTSQGNAQKLFDTMRQQGWYNINQQNKNTRQQYRQDFASRNETYCNRAPISSLKKTINPGLDGTYRGKSGINTSRPRYVEQYNTPQ